MCILTNFIAVQSLEVFISEMGGIFSEISISRVGCKHDI
jgi:hypothetical protein